MVTMHRKMKTQEINYIKYCLENSDKSISYFKDKYALQLLSHKFEDNSKLSDIRQSEYSKLLDKQVVKNLTQGFGNGLWNSNQANNYWPANQSYFSYELASWGEESKWRKSGYFQVSRPEKNLVLQVLFGGNHNNKFNRILGANLQEHLTYKLHPVHAKQNTMGWARMDIDLDRGEVLIEEIQNDWFRLLKGLKLQFEEIVAGRRQATDLFEEVGMVRLQNYIDYIRPIMRIWDELVMSSVIEFIRQELGIKIIWYHTFDTGNNFKELNSYSNKPPVSLYTKLPNKFCFQLNQEGPEMLRNCQYLKKYFKKRNKNEWFLLEV